MERARKQVPDYSDEQPASSTDEGSLSQGESSTTQQKMSAMGTTATEGAKELARDAQGQMRQVAEETKHQLRTLTDEGRNQLRSQAEFQTQRASHNLRTLSDQTRALADGRPAEAGPLVGYLGDVSGRLSNWAERLEQRGFDGLVTDVSGFARRRPMAFIGACALAGFAVTRVTRSARSDAQSQQQVPAPERAIGAA